jgi:hypothetical protein
VALVPIEDLDAIEYIENKIDREEIRKAYEEQGDEPFEKWEDVKKELGIE